MNLLIRIFIFFFIEVMSRKIKDKHDYFPSPKHKPHFHVINNNEVLLSIGTYHRTLFKQGKC